MSTDIEQWVDKSAELTRPDKVVWLDGSPGEYESLVRTMMDDGSLVELNRKTHPGCYLHRSHPNDVARTEHLTFICTNDRETAGPNNNWMAPKEAKERVRP